MCRQRTSQFFAWFLGEKRPRSKKNVCALKMLYHKSSFACMIFFLFFNYNIWRHVIHTRTALKWQQRWDFISFAFLLPAQFSNIATADLASPAQPVALLLMTAGCLRSHGHQHGHHTFCLKPFAPQGLQDSTGKRRSFQEVPSFSASHQIQTPPKSLKRQKQQHNLNCLFHFYSIIPKSFPLLSALYAIICQTVH